MRWKKLGSSRGSVVTTVALTIPMMMGMVSMGVDWGQVSVAQFGVRAAADEAALAAASALSTSPKTESEIAAAYTLAKGRADKYTAELGVNDLTFTVDTVTLGYYDRAGGTGWSTTVPTGKSPNAVQVKVSTNVHLSFAALFGTSDLAISRTTKAGTSVIPGRAPDLVIVQDVTPSMSSTDIANSKLANEALVDCIEKNAHPSTRGAYVKFANIDKTVTTLKSYSDSPNELYNAVAGISPTTAYSNTGICVGGGCTSHSAGLYAAVDILNKATEPPEGVGQAIIVITDGAPYTNDSGCSGVASSSGTATPYQKWLTDSSGGRCGQVASQTTATGCNNIGGRWVTTGSGRTATTKCVPSDNGAEGAGAAGPGKCSTGSATSEARCEGGGGTWIRTTSATANPSSQTQWTDSARNLAYTGTWGPIDVYGVYYSSGAGATYKSDNQKFITNHVLRGAGSDLGVLDAPTGPTLVDALQDLCEEYVVGSPGLIQD